MAERKDVEQGASGDSRLARVNRMPGRVRRLLARLRAAMRGADESRLREEIDQHLSAATAENVRRGLSPADARRQALIAFGAVEAMKDRYRDEQRLLEAARQDVRHAFRRLRRAPLFTTTAVLSLAIGIGANTAVFTLIDRVLIRSLPIGDPQDVVIVDALPSREGQQRRFSYPAYLQLRESTALDGLAARAVMPIYGTFNGQVARIRAELVSGNYFSLLGTGAHAGRVLTADDDRTPGAHSVAVIGEGFWRRALGSDPAVLGRAARINDHPFTIVGIADARFTGIEVGTPVDIWIPMSMQREIGRDLLANERTNWIQIVGRLRAGTSAASAAADLTSHALATGALRIEPGMARAPQFALRPGGTGDSAVRRELGPALRVLQALTALALLLACANVAGLLAVQSVGRQAEVALRSMLGASSGRLARQFLAESGTLAMLGGLAGLVAAPWAASLLAGSYPTQPIVDARIDVRVIAFAIAISVLSALAIGLAPVGVALRSDLFRAAPRRSARRLLGRVTVHDAIVVTQIAVSLTMIISAGLLVQSVRLLRSVDLGVDTRDMLLVTADPRAAGYSRSRIEAFWTNTLERVRTIHSVERASIARTVPFAPGRQRQPVFDPAAGATVEIDVNVVGPDYFATLDIGVREGREFTDADTASAPLVAIVNEALAASLWPRQSPIGKRLQLGTGPTRERPDRPAAIQLDVVGLVRDVKYRDLRDGPVPMFYRPVPQAGSSDAMTLHVRLSGDVEPVVNTLRAEMQRAEPAVPLFDITTLDDRLNASFGQTRQAAALTGLFGMLALALCAVGAYGVIALAVGRQTHDIGVRIALGAEPAHIVRGIARHGAAIVFAGLFAGVAASLAFTRVWQAMLFGIAPWDPSTFIAMAAVMAAVSLAAVYVPATRASRLDPVQAIRQD